jgi:excisionase family DNA binding protein
MVTADDDPLRTVHETAVQLHVSDPTVDRYIRDKRLRAVRVGPRGKRVFQSSIDEMKNAPLTSIPFPGKRFLKPKARETA